MNREKRAGRQGREHGEGNGTRDREKEEEAGEIERGGGGGAGGAKGGGRNATPGVTLWVMAMTRTTGPVCNGTICGLAVRPGGCQARQESGEGRAGHETRVM